MSRVREHRTVALVGFDVLAVLVAYHAFGLFRYGPFGVSDVAMHLTRLALAAAVLQTAVGLSLRLYQGRTIVASSEDSVRLGAAVVTGGVLVSGFNALTGEQYVSRIVPAGATFLALAAVLFGRLWWRTLDLKLQTGEHETARALIFGAGSAGRQLARSMAATPAAGMRPVGFLDDDPWKRRLRADGIAVIGARKDLEAAAMQTSATVLVIAVPSAEPELLRDVSRRARAAGLEVKVLPRVDALLTSAVTMRDVRDINVHDLLGRGVVDTDVASIAGYLTNKRVLVTGAGGSIGSELCLQINKWNPAELIMLDRDESGLHGVQLALHGKAMLDDPGVVLADIRDRDALMRVFQERRPEVVFHAAALKHLPMLEQYPVEAAKTNVLGTLNVLHAAAAVGAERFVNISTDKAADPTSVLGLSKRVAERLTASVAADTAGTYLSVRFGNVLGSRGSVLTSFAAQIAAGGPVTVTHPDVTRYFMTVQEAVQLVIGAAAIGRDGEALILDMGEPVSIRQVAEQLIEQSGRHDIEIVYTGLREGEKLHEVLLSAEELDNRPISPLFSHVAVPELQAAYVQSQRLDVDEDEMRKRLYDWCVQDPAPLQEEREYAPRTWSGVES